MVRLMCLVLAGVAVSIGSEMTLAQATVPAQPAVVEAPAPNDYRDEKTWLCRPGRTGDACDIDLTTTVVAADGTLARETWAPNPKAAVDCFYVYPTVSTDPTENSDMTADPAERNVVAQQFARFGSKCRLFAPLYRQTTLVGLRKRLAGGLSFEQGVQYGDVRDAWRSYLQHDNGGRGVVLVGHSQGAYVLLELLRQEVEGKPVQKQLVSALILGATLDVPPGKDVGGALKQIPLCRRPGQIGCVVNYASFRSTVPPPAGTLFGKPRDAAMSGSCTNPVTLGEGPTPLHAYLATSGRTITGTVAPKSWVTPERAIDTPWVSVPGLLTARCATNEHATYLEITVNADPADPRVDDITGDIGAVGKPLPAWGLHLIDVNLAMGNLLDLVTGQSAAYARR